MTTKSKVIEGYNYCKEHGSIGGQNCNGRFERYTENGKAIEFVDDYRSKCPYGSLKGECLTVLISDAVSLFKDEGGQNGNSNNT